MRAVSCVLLLAAAAAACSPTSSDSAPVSDRDGAAPEAGEEVSTAVPGSSLAAVRVGMSYREVRALLGEAKAVGFNRLVFGRYEDRGLEVVFASPSEDSLTDDAVVLAVGAQGSASMVGTPRVGQTRADIEKKFGKSPDPTGNIDHYPLGFSVKYAAPSSPDAPTASAVAVGVSVFTPYREFGAPPEMTPTASPDVKPVPVVDPARIRTIDMHLHPGYFGRIPSATKGFLVASTPEFTQVYAPGVLSAALDPWAPFVGVKAQTELAEVDHAVLYAVYTQKTTGYFTNEDLEAVLTDPRNKSADGLPWAWGLASINFFDGYVDDAGAVVPSIAKARLDALKSYLTKRRDLFIGIKLAHAHQAVAFDDARYLGVYDVARETSAPVYLHTGFSPFPNAKKDPAFYDPQGLENTVMNSKNVTFILGHVGQGDPRAVEHALLLAKKYDNVFLEISALNRPLLLDEHGDEKTPDAAAPQYPFVIEQIKARGLISKTIFGTDGPQFSGMVRSYTQLIRKTMTEKGYTADEIKAVMTGNFVRVFFPGR